MSGLPEWRRSTRAPGAEHITPEALGSRPDAFDPLRPEHDAGAPTLGQRFTTRRERREAERREAAERLRHPIRARREERRYEASRYDGPRSEDGVQRSEESRPTALPPEPNPDSDAGVLARSEPGSPGSDASESGATEPGAPKSGADAEAGAHAGRGAEGGRTEGPSADEESSDDVLGSLAQTVAPAPPRRRRRGLLVWSVALLSVAALIVVGGLTLPWLQGLVAGEHDSDDYEGSGETPVTFVIESGQDGGAIGENLVRQDVVKSYAAFMRAAESQTTDAVFQPGAYQLRTRMSADSAVKALLDPASRTGSGVTVPEGTSESRILAKLAEASGVSEARLKQAAENVDAYDVPPQVKRLGRLEGWLFPATYDFAPDTPPERMLQQMVARTNQERDELGVKGNEARFRAITFGALIQREAGSVEDMGKVARVFQNRLDGKLPAGRYLQSDASVSYGTGRTDDIETTPQERADASNRYNTYANEGLPAGPISNPGVDAVRAALNPTPGDWLYFVTVNTETGETKFATTEEEHQRNVEEWQRNARAQQSNG